VVVENPAGVVPAPSPEDAATEFGAALHRFTQRWLEALQDVGPAVTAPRPVVLAMANDVAVLQDLQGRFSRSQPARRRTGDHAKRSQRH
jgi:hypothetical protein